MSAVLDILVAELRTLLDERTFALRDGELTADAWQRACARDLLDYHVAAYLADKPGDRVLRSADKRILGNVIGNQVDFLNTFADVLETVDADDWSTKYEARARLYAGALAHSHSRGATFGLPLPYYPTERTICMSQDRCRWRIETIDVEAGDYDAYWTLGSGSGETCETCLDRETKNPYQIRGGQLL